MRSQQAREISRVADRDDLTQGKPRTTRMIERRQRVIDAFAAAFAAKGYHGVGMREIAQDLELNPGTLYHYLDSKDDALLAVCLAGQQRALSDLVAALEAAPDFSSRVNRLFELHIASLAHVGDHLQVYISYRMLVPWPLAEPLRVAWAIYRTRLKRLFEDGIGRNEILPDLDLKNASRMLTGIHRDLNLLHKGSRHHEMLAFARTAVAIFLRGVAR